jgi:flagellum-specific ATP synthase
MTLRAHGRKVVRSARGLVPLANHLSVLNLADIVRVTGTVTTIGETQIRVSGLSTAVRLDDHVVFSGWGGRAVVTRILPDEIIVVPLGTTAPLRIGDHVHAMGPFRIAPTMCWKGRVLDPFGRPLDAAGPLRQGDIAYAIDTPAPVAMQRASTGSPFRTGVRVIDAFTPLCAGQRVGLFAGSGVGKSTLLGMVARDSAADVVIVALVGERGREVKEFIDETLAASRDKVIAVVATSDTSVLARRAAPLTAMAIAEAFRAKGQSVLLVIDSLTRFAAAQRDVALASGEPPVLRGYPPSVFRHLASLLERAGPAAADEGLITLVATVLVDGDDHNEPVADAVRGIVDGHIVLDRQIGSSGRWPAVDIRASLSRLAHRVWGDQEAALIREARGLIDLFERTADLRSIGDVKTGHDQQLDRAVRLAPQIYNAIIQRPDDVPSDDIFRRLEQLLAT